MSSSTTTNKFVLLAGTAAVAVVGFIIYQNISQSPKFKELEEEVKEEAKEGAVVVKSAIGELIESAKVLLTPLRPTSADGESVPDEKTYADSVKTKLGELINAANDLLTPVKQVKFEELIEAAKSLLPSSSKAGEEPVATNETSLPNSFSGLIEAAKSLLTPTKKSVVVEEVKTLYDVVFVLGGPGAGKGTQSELIVSTFGYAHLSAGDLLREERNSGSELAEMINTFIKEGKIVPAEVTVGLLRAAMEKNAGKKFLVDGFPRDLDNLRCWEEKMGEVANVQFLLFLDCPEEIMQERLLERGKTSGRNDDNIESIKKRFKTYQDSTRPIIEHFQSISKCRQVDANRDKDVVFAEVSTHFLS